MEVYKKTASTILLLLAFTTSSSCQVTATLPLDSYDFSSGAYLKDLDNQLPFYVGTWEGIYDNKKYTFQFTIFYQHLSEFTTGYYHYEDELMVKFKVVDLTTGITLYDNLSATDFVDYKIFLASLGLGSFVYIDKDNCRNHAEFSLFKVSGTTNQLYYNQFSLRGFGGLDDCPYQNQEDIPMFLPKGNFVLTKL